MDKNLVHFKTYCGMSTTGMVKKISGLKFEANLGQLSSLSFPEKLIKIRINFFPRSYLAFKHFNESKNKCCVF